MIISNLDTDRDVIVVAEIGNNHEGNFDVAKELVVKAAEAGVDIIKFQTFRTDHYVARAETARHARLKGFELTFQQFEELSKLARSKGAAFMSTPFDLESAAFLDHVVDAFKIASGDNDFYPLMRRVASFGKPVIVSTGASDAAQVERTIRFLQSEQAKLPRAPGLAVLHCVSAYPAPPEEANLRAIPWLASHFPGVVPGYSDHTMGLDAALASVALGARIVEKHFTLDHHYSEFRDHQLSADPQEMRTLVQKIRVVSKMLGKEEKRVMPAEAGGLASLRRSIVAGRDLPAGHAIAAEDLTWVRPAGGLRPGEESVLVGRRLKRAVGFSQRIDVADTE